MLIGGGMPNDKGSIPTEQPCQFSLYHYKRRNRRIDRT